LTVAKTVNAPGVTFANATFGVQNETDGIHNNYPGGQAFRESLPTRIIVVVSSE